MTIKVTFAHDVYQGHKMLGTCLAKNKTSEHFCDNLHHSQSSWFTLGCPNKLGWLAIIGLALYICFFAPGMGIVPWAVNLEIYPLTYRGIGGGFAATCLWVANLIVSETFLTLTKAIGPDMSFLLFMCIALFTLGFVYLFVPETKGMSLENLEKMLHDMHMQKKNGGKWSSFTYSSIMEVNGAPLCSSIARMLQNLADTLTTWYTFSLCHFY